MDVESVERLRDLAVDKTVYIVGSGPSLDEFPIKELEDRLTICLNDTGGQVPCSFWLYGDPKFARWKASKVLTRNSSIGAGSATRKAANPTSSARQASLA